MDLEHSVDLTPGDVWTDQQIAVVRTLTARAYRAETGRDEARAALDRVRRLLAAWETKAQPGTHRGHAAALRDALRPEAT
jgi:hypothetical protein